MRIRSLALKTELGLAAAKGVLEDRDDYVVVRTPDHPEYYFGNVLVLAAPPQVGEVAYWRRRFADEFRGTPEVRHVAFRWDSTSDAGALDELRAAGFHVDNDWVMTAEAIAAPPVPFEIRALRPDEMQAVADLGFLISDDHSDKFRRFINKRSAWKAHIIERGLGTFWGAFDGDTLVGSLGLVKLDRLARYQDVETAPTHRKRGIASALLATAAAGIDHISAPLRGAARPGEAGPFGVERFVIVAEPESAASRVYARAGFTVQGRMVSTFSAPASR